MTRLFLKKIMFSGLASLLATGCGFQPLLTGQHDTPQQFTFKIHGSGYSAYKFRRELEKQLALTPQVSDQAYTIKVNLAEGYVPVAYGIDATVARSQVQATAAYELVKSDQRIAIGSVTSYSSYILNYGEEFSTRSAQAAAIERTLINLSEELTREIMLKIRVAPEKGDVHNIKDSTELDDEW